MIDGFEYKCLAHYENSKDIEILLNYWTFQN